MVKHTGWLAALAKVLCNDPVKLRKNCEPSSTRRRTAAVKVKAGENRVGSLNDKVVFCTGTVTRQKRRRKMTTNEGGELGARKVVHIRYIGGLLECRAG